MSIIRRIAFSSLLPLREATLAPKVYVMSSAMSVRWKGHSQYMNKKGAIKAAGMRRDKMKTLYSIRIFQAVQVFSLLSGVTLLLIKCIVFRPRMIPTPNATEPSPRCSTPCWRKIWKKVGSITPAREQ